MTLIPSSVKKGSARRPPTDPKKFYKLMAVSGACVVRCTMIGRGGSLRVDWSANGMPAPVPGGRAVDAVLDYLGDFLIIEEVAC